MNIVKKLKLALLATSVMFFPKAGHTIKPEDQKPSAGPSRQSPRPEDESPVFNSMLPAHPSSNPSPVAAGSSSSLDEPQQMEQLFGRRFVPNNEIKERLASLRVTKSPEEIQGITDAIRDNLIKKFINPLLDNTRQNYPKRFYKGNAFNSKHQEALSSTEELVAYALTLSKEQIEERSNALVDLIVDTDLSQSELRLAVGLDKSRRNILIDALNEWGILLPPVIGSILKLDANQIIHRTNAIKSSISPDHFSLFSSLLPSDEKEDTSTGPLLLINVLESLMKLKTQDILDRISPMNTMIKNMSYSDFIGATKKAASFLSTDELKLRVEKGTSILSASPDLMPVATELRYLSLRLNPADFDAVVGLVRGHQDLLVPWLRAQNFDSPVFGYSLDEIYATANLVHNKNYFLTDFLPKVGAKFKELNGFSLEDNTILKTFFPSLAYAGSSKDRALFPSRYSDHSSLYSFSPGTLANFSRDNLEKTIEQVGSIYMNLFQPAPFSEFQPSGGLESGPASSSAPGPSSSSGPMLEPAPSSNRAIHSAPTTFRTTGANENAEIKHSAIYASFPYQNKPGAAYSLIINHRTKDKGSEVRVFNPNTKTYIDLGRLSQSAVLVTKFLISLPYLHQHLLILLVHQ
ncbi:hypothetical protein QM565_03620 [Geitlerinema splendidum]|nr:hypothetical protein [Geitlerinema splendidum]